MSRAHDRSYCIYIAMHKSDVTVTDSTKRRNKNGACEHQTGSAVSSLAAYIPINGHGSAALNVAATSTKHILHYKYIVMWMARAFLGNDL
jgi:hypothetical protein